MVLEMRRALEELKSGDSQGYRTLFNATYEETYIRSLLIIRKEEQMTDFMRDLFRDLFTAPDEAEDAKDLEKWFLEKFYQRLRKHYHRLLEKQEKTTSVSEGAKTLSGIPGAFPLLHRIMLVMAFKDDFTAGEISAIFGLGEEKIQAELNKLEKALPSLVKDQLENQSAYLANWKVLLLGASKEMIHAGNDGWVETLYKDAMSAAGVVENTAAKQSEDFDYFVADPEPEPEPVKPKKKPVPVVEEEPEEDEEEYDDEDEEPDDDDEYEDDDEDEDDDDDRYDWDMEDDGKRMVILGVVLALIIVAVIGLVAFRIFGKGDKEEDSKDPVQTEQEAEEDGDKLIVKGGEDDFGEEEPEEPVEEPVEAPEEEPTEAPEEEEPQTTVMKVKPDSMRVRSEPNTNCEVVTSVKSGDRLEVIGEANEDGWVQVRCIDQDGKEGYAKIENLASE